MGDIAEDRAKAAQLPEGDVIRLLLEQHAQVRELFSQVKTAQGDEKKAQFDRLRALLAVHETAEQMVLRPVTDEVGGGSVAQARIQEETEANEVLAELEKLDVTSMDFDTRLAAFEESVDEHAESEETQEFPLILANCSAEQRAKLGSRIKAAESIAPTHPHPSTSGKPAAQMTVGPVASIIDRVRDALSHSGS
jgi:hypothetical protein